MCALRCVSTRMFANWDDDNNDDDEEQQCEKWIEAQLENVRTRRQRVAKQSIGPDKCER